MKPFEYKNLKEFDSHILKFLIVMIIYLLLLGVF